MCARHFKVISCGPLARAVLKGSEVWALLLVVASDGVIKGFTRISN